ncbi:two-component system response regulator [Lachnoclostridium sp. An169]|uniref:response regulator n=1 Tax=Lachnoclostridium sp. An169 TaxID=1965569 RepID=UPI000B39E41E|nr:response regulator [Lachnoclostridium sp. An169]OUP83282.1 two-component system response regulator [Lachnoclostridium sp. An169]HJA68064.1 response regulator [Candidatus Mediterraneibacter cottocaccae]
MLKVLLVDDEPFILQGMEKLVNWEKEGFEIAAAVSDGAEALSYFENNRVDLILADINMPVMDGLELLKRVRSSERNSSVQFVILSGYADFGYAQEAIQYSCTDYILKPVEKEKLLQVLRKIRKMYSAEIEKTKETKKLEGSYLDRKLIAVIQGKYDESDLDYAGKHMRLSEKVRYIEILIDMPDWLERGDEEKSAEQKRLYRACLEYLQEDWTHCIMDVSRHEKIYDTGFILCGYMWENTGEKKYLSDFLAYLCGVLDMPVVMICGKEVKNLGDIAKSYSTARMLRSFQGFREKKQIYFYEEEVQVHTDGVVLCKNSLDFLLRAIEQNDHAQIMKGADLFFEEMRQRGMSGDIMKLNINYLLFQLIHLAAEQDDTVNQEEVLRTISEGTFESGVLRGSKAHLCRVACEYGDYLMQMRKNASRGILGKIEKEIRERYAENLTLKELGNKYYLNSAYLGQLFRKKYGKSFRDYLNHYRIEQAAQMLLRTEDKIYQIAEKAGYHDLDYFVNRFIEIKGCTPAKYRKQAGNTDK